MKTNRHRAGFEELVGQIQATSDALQQDALVVINRSVTARAWLTGYYIVEYEQHGEDRAKYGEGLLKRIEERLGAKGFSVESLKKFRLFYQTYPTLAQPVAAYIASRFAKRESVITQLPYIDVTPIGESAITQSESSSLLVENGEDVTISPWALFSRLSYTHIVKLLPLADDLQRTFYAFEAMRGTWSVRELQRQRPLLRLTQRTQRGAKVVGRVAPRPPMVGRDRRARRDEFRQDLQD